MSKPQSRVDFSGKGNLGYLNLADAIVVTKVDYAYVEPNQLFPEQVMPLLAVQFGGFPRVGPDVSRAMLLRPPTAGALIGSLIALATMRGCVEEMLAAASEELRQTTMGGVYLDVHKRDPKEN